MSSISAYPFTVSEHVVIASYLGVEPLCDANRLPEKKVAIKGLGYEAWEAGLYEPEAAVVAAIALESIYEHLPDLGEGRRYTPNGECEEITGRPTNDRRADRPVKLTPQFLLSIDLSNIGLCWPVSFYLTQLPLYGCYVVTESAPAQDCHGAWDVAIGTISLEAKDPVKDAAEVVKTYWQWTAVEFGQPRWGRLLGEGWIDAPTAHRLADEVWGDSPDDEAEC